MDQYVTGEAIRTLREKAGFTQAELASKICVSDKTVSKWEREESTPDAALPGRPNRTSSANRMKHAQAISSYRKTFT